MICFHDIVHMVIVEHHLEFSEIDSSESEESHCCSGMTAMNNAEHLKISPDYLNKDFIPKFLCQKLQSKTYNIIKPPIA